MKPSDPPPPLSRSELLHVAALLLAALALFGGALGWHFGIAGPALFEWTAQSVSGARPTP